jgi:hypothetical protein
MNEDNEIELLKKKKLDYQDEIKEIESKLIIKNDELVKKRFKEIICFISYKGKWFKKVDKIFFDTFGVYRFLIESKSNSGWNVEINNYWSGSVSKSLIKYKIILFHGNYRNIKPFKLGNITMTKLIGDIITKDGYIASFYKSEKNNKKNKVIGIRYNTTFFSCEDIIDIIDQIYRKKN